MRQAEIHEVQIVVHSAWCQHDCLAKRFHCLWRITHRFISGRSQVERVRIWSRASRQRSQRLDRVVRTMIGELHRRELHPRGAISGFESNKVLEYRYRFVMPLQNRETLGVFVEC